MLERGMRHLGLLMITWMRSRAETRMWQLEDDRKTD